MSKTRTVACIVAALLATTSHASADTAAGWDFSQYYVDGLKLQDPSVAAPATVESNYSSFDPTNGAGTEANAIGDATLTGGVLPAAGSNSANLSGAAEVFGDLDYDSHVILQSEGQVSKSYMRLSAGESPGTAEFRVDLAGASIPDQGGWSVVFDGEALGGTSEVEVSYSTDCSSWVNYGTVVLDDDPSTSDVFDVALDAAASGLGCVELAMDPTSGTGGRPFVDNVTIKVPEPSASAGLLAGAAALFVLERRRKKRR